MAGVTSVVIDGTTYMVDDINAVDFSEEQGLTEQQQQQGRSNIGAAALEALAGKADKADLDALEGTVGELSDDVDGLTEALADKADVIVDTASGAIASFPDGMAAPAKDITIAIEPVQAGSGDPSPTNVRPISGWTGANVTRTGKNLLDASAAEIGTAWNGTFNTARARLVIPLKQNTQYTLTMNGTNALDGVFSRLSTVIPPSDIDERTFPYSFDSGVNDYLVLGFNKTAISQADINALNLQLEFGSTATDYEPYHGETYDITFPAEAGTVYGGTLDVTTGVLTVDRGATTIGAIGRWYAQGGYFARYATYALQNVIKKSNSEICVLSDTYPGRSDAGTIANTNQIYSNSGGLIKVNDLEYQEQSQAGIDAFVAARSTAQIVYKLATPQTYQLTPTEVEMLLGDNNVWADTGDSTVTYRADTKLYIQKINAPTDDDMIADAQIASGKYFIVGGNLYRSTTTIPAGDTITPGTNCILTNLADALNALNT